MLASLIELANQQINEIPPPDETDGFEVSQLSIVYRSINS